jgi:hypothetical protein
VELEIAERQIVAKADPAEPCNWRPVAQARSISEGFVHVATGNFLLLDVIGMAAPGGLVCPNSSGRWRTIPGPDPQKRRIGGQYA